jgi:hypothetical protein
MVTKRGEVKLIDFGIARFFSNRATRDTQALGTPGYAPPEQYGNAQTDNRADIYALGATLYHLLTNYDVGGTPFSLPPLRSRNATISARTADAIEHATKLDRKDRFGDIAEFARDLGVGARSKANAGAQSARTGQPQGQPRPTASQRAAPGAGANGARPKGFGAPGARTNGAAGRAGQGGPISAGLAALGKAGTAGAVAAGAQLIKARFDPKAPAPTAADLGHTFIAAARTAFGPGVAPLVQPRQIDLGQLRAGQDGSMTLTISGLNGASVSGTVKPLAAWLRVDKNQFSGPSTLIQVTARTSQIQGIGPQHSNIEVAVGNQLIYIPVRLDVAPAPGAQAAPWPQHMPQPKPQPRPQPRPQAYAAPQPAAAGGPPFVAGVRRSAQASAQKAAAQAAQQTATYTAPRPSRSLDSLRLPLSLACALALAFTLPLLGATFALPHLSGIFATPLWQARMALAIGMLGALLGASLAYIGAPSSPGRLRTAALLGIAGALLASAFTAPWQLTPGFAHLLPGAAQVGALALTMPLLVAVGAALGAMSVVSHAILAVARYIATRYRLVLLTAAIAGGWLGFTAAQTALSAIFQQAPFALSLVGGCGLIIGVAIGLTLAAPVGYLVRRFAFG